MRLSPSSDRVAGARRFGLELSKALRTRERTQRGIAVEAGIGRSRLANWLNGTSLPAVETADRLADLLMWPSLATIARAGRERDCDNCGRRFTVESPSPRKYCSTECQRFRNAKVRGERDLSRVVLERRVRRYMAAVSEMCAGCEPTGLCRTPACPLQLAGVSSLPVAKESIA